MVETQSIEKSTQKRWTTKRTKLIVGGIVVAIVVGYLIVSAAQGSAAYYMTVQELEARGPSNRNVRVAGTVVDGSIVWDPRALQLHFEMADGSGQLPVTYNGARPDMFLDGAELVIEGHLTPDGVFEARTIILKCPSKYEGEG